MSGKRAGKFRLGVSISLRQLQKYCQPWRTQELHVKEMTQRYEVPPGDEMQIDFGFDEVLIAGVKTCVCVFVAVLSYSRRVFAKPVFVKILQKNWLGAFLPLKNLSRGFAPALRYPRIFFKHE